MAKTTHSYAVRLSLEQGGRVKAELVSVGETGERSLKRIEQGGEKASRGLEGLSGRVGFLRTGIGSLGAAIAGAVSIGGLAALINRSIDAADAVGKTADKIGVGVAALQELRYAASLAGIEQQTLDMALQRFVRRTAEAARGTGEAKQALASMGVALRDQHGNIRAAEDLLGDVANAFVRIEDPAERVRLAFKLFDSEGVAMVNMLSRGADSLEQTRARARELGIVLDEDLVRNAAKAKDELDTLSKVVSANLTRALLDLAPAITDAAEGLSGLAADAGVAYEELKLLLQGDFNFENLSLRSTQRIVAERRQELVEIAKELKAIGDVGFADDPLAWARRQVLERRLSARVAQYRQWAAKLAGLQAQAAKEAPKPSTPDAGSTPDRIDAGIKSAKDRAARLVKLEEDLQRQLFEATHEGADKIRAEYQRLVTDAQTLIAPDGGNLERVGRLMGEAATLRDARLAELDQREAESAAKRVAANDKIVDTLEAERAALTATQRQQAIDTALRRLSADATEAQRTQVRALAGALFDEQQALEAAEKLKRETAPRDKAIQALRDEVGGLQQLTEARRNGEGAYERLVDLQQAEAEATRMGIGPADAQRAAVVALLLEKERLLSVSEMFAEAHAAEAAAIDDLGASYDAALATYREVQRATAAEVKERDARLDDYIGQLEQANALAAMRPEERARQVALAGARRLLLDQEGSAVRELSEAERQRILVAVETQLALERQTASYQVLEQFGERAFDRIGEAATQMAFESGQAWTSFGNLALAVLSELGQEMFRLAAINPLKNALFGTSSPTLSSFGGPLGNIFGDLFGDLFGPSVPAGGTGSAGSLGVVGAQPFHRGGIAGIDNGPVRPVPAALYADAPRFHGGLLAPDEVPAILRRGESVLTPAQMRAVSGGSVTIEINIDARGAELGVEERIQAALARATPLIVTQAKAAVQREHRSAPTYLGSIR